MTFEEHVAYFTFSDWNLMVMSLINTLIKNGIYVTNNHPKVSRYPWTWKFKASKDEILTHVFHHSDFEGRDPKGQLRYLYETLRPMAIKIFPEYEKYEQNVIRNIENRKEEEKYERETHGQDPVPGETNDQESIPRCSERDQESGGSDDQTGEG